MGDRAIVNSASPAESCPILKPVNSTVSNQLLRVAVHYSDFSVNQHADNLNLTTGDTDAGRERNRVGRRGLSPVEPNSGERSRGVF